MSVASSRNVILLLPLLFPLLLTPRSHGQRAGSEASTDGASCQIQEQQQAVSVPLQVQDTSGAVVPGAAVSVKCGVYSATGVTDGEGKLSLRVHPGGYRVSVQAPGFTTLVQSERLPATAGALQLTLSVGTATDVVNVSANTGFVPFASNAGSKSNAPLIEVPQSISIINQQEMESRNVITMNEALRYTAGVQADEYGVEPRFDWLKIRGFAAETFGVFRDGMRFNSLSGKLDPYELESVEVLKGPSSVLYGQVPPGGLINQVTKRPPAERRTEIGAQFGSFDRRQFQFDTGGPIDRHQVWRYRLLGLVRNSGTQVDYTPDNRRLIAPSMTWHPSDRTNLTVLADYQHDGTRWSQFLPSNGTLYNTNPNGIIPVNTFLGEPGWEHVKREQYSAGYTGDHLFSDGWNVHSNYRYQYINFDGTTVYGAGFDGASTTDVIRYAYALPRWNRIHTVDTRGLRRFAQGNWEQTILLGYDYGHVDIASKSAFAQVADINIYRPVYGVTTIPTMSPYLNQDSLLQQNGIYGQDQIKYRNRLVITLGGRQDFAKNDIADFITPSASTSHLDRRFTGRAGVGYLFDNGLSPYFSYATSFLPNAGSTVNINNDQTQTEPAKPSDARQIEGGVKFQPKTWNSFITASLFQINQTNVLTSSGMLSIQTGEVRSRGFELEGVASLARGLNLHGSYTLTATNTVKSETTSNLGKWLPQTPRNQLGMLADYTVPAGRVSGLGGNFGVRFVGTNAADNANTFFVPKYTLIDGALRYGYRGVMLSVNATNLTNKRYVATCSGASYCFYGFVRNVIGTVKYSF